MEVREMYKNFQEFSNQDALTFGCKVIKIVEEKKLKPVRIRVVKDHDIVFQYLMDGKKSDEWLNKKQHMVEETHHASLHVFEHHEDYPTIDVACGGGYPLFINHEYRGCFIVSGLDHIDDHKLILEALGEAV